MSTLPNRSRNLSLLFRELQRLGVVRVDVRFADTGAIEAVTVVTGSLQCTVSQQDLRTTFLGLSMTLEDAAGVPFIMSIPAAIGAAALSADGDDDYRATVTLDVRGHTITRTMPVVFVDPRVIFGATG